MSDHDVDKAGNPPEVNPDKIEIYHLKEHIAELEAEIERYKAEVASANNSAFGSECKNILGLAKQIEVIKQYSTEYWKKTKELESRLRVSQGAYETATEMCDKARVERDAAINKVANVMLNHGLATGHADTLESLLSELDAELIELRKDDC